MVSPFPSIKKTGLLKSVRKYAQIANLEIAFVRVQGVDPLTLLFEISPNSAAGSRQIGMQSRKVTCVEAYFGLGLGTCRATCEPIEVFPK